MGKPQVDLSSDETLVAKCAIACRRSRRRSANRVLGRSRVVRTHAEKNQLTDGSNPGARTARAHTHLTNDDVKVLPQSPFEFIINKCERWQIIVNETRKHGHDCA